ncbi:uncharacterized protein LOC123667554 [Melitaea cinxia]|uniref:uncharacterized protein LOC123667554 n=1 Tax=Melitaea cinxia TaxID=113334 RepID=UPI001E271849|nr:uncharacterized protein LOC123667554 [Melitaea cinxia]
MKVLIVLGFCLVAVSAYRQYDPYYQQYQGLTNYYGRTAHYYEPQEYHNQHYYNKLPYYNPGYYYGDKSSYGQSGHEANYNAPLYYAPGYNQGYQTYSDDHPSLNQEYYGKHAYEVTQQ